MRSRGGFTLVELLVAIGIMGVLASIVIVAINPAKQMGDARNTHRKFDVNTILNSFGQFAIDSDGTFHPVNIDGTPLAASCFVSATPKKLCKAETANGTAEGECGHTDVQCVWSRHLSGTYLASIPADPKDTENTTAEQAMVDYLVSSIAPGRFQVDAPRAENEQTISATR